MLELSEQRCGNSASLQGGEGKQCRGARDGRDLAADGVNVEGYFGGGGHASSCPSTLSTAPT